MDGFLITNNDCFVDAIGEILTVFIEMRDNKIEIPWSLAVMFCQVGLSVRN